MADVPFTSSGHTSATEATLISSIVQDQLLREAKLLPTVSDYSAMAKKGVKTIDLPRFGGQFSGPAAQNVDGATTVDFQAVAFAADSLNLNKHVNLPYRIPDRVSKQSGINLEAELAKSAGREMANYVDDQIIVELKLASASAPDHRIQLSGGTNDEITLADISEARRLLNVQNVPMPDRYLLVSPDQEKVMLNISNFIKANEYGAREGLLNGEIGRVYGMTVIVHNGLAATEAIAYHKSCCAVAMQQEVEFETQRAPVNLKATDYSFSMLWGAKVLDSGKRQVLLNATGS